MKKVLWFILLLFIFNCQNTNQKHKFCITKTQSNFRDLFEFIPKEVDIVFNLSDALKKSSQQNKPILIIFTSYLNKSERDLDWKIIKESKTESIIQKEFVLTILLLDDKTKINNIDTLKKNHKNKIIKTVGNCNADIQIRKYKSNAQPLYCIVDEDFKNLVEPIGFVTDTELFQRFIKKGLDEYRQ